MGLSKAEKCTHVYEMNWNQGCLTSKPMLLSTILYRNLKMEAWDLVAVVVGEGSVWIFLGGLE